MLRLPNINFSAVLLIQERLQVQKSDLKIPVLPKWSVNDHGWVKSTYLGTLPAPQNVNPILRIFIKGFGCDKKKTGRKGKGMLKMFLI